MHSLPICGLNSRHQRGNLFRKPIHALISEGVIPKDARRVRAFSFFRSRACGLGILGGLGGFAESNKTFRLTIPFVRFACDSCGYTRIALPEMKSTEPLRVPLQSVTHRTGIAATAHPVDPRATPALRVGRGFVLAPEIGRILPAANALTSART